MFRIKVKSKSRTAIVFWLLCVTNNRSFEQAINVGRTNPDIDLVKLKSLSNLMTLFIHRSVRNIKGSFFDMQTVIPKGVNNPGAALNVYRVNFW